MPAYRFRRLFSHGTAPALLVGAALLAGAASAQTWEYKSYKRGGRGGQSDAERFVSGTITLDETPAGATLRMSAGATDACWRNAVPAVVTRSEATTVIELQQPVAGCDVVRYVIRNDGSGGHKETLVGERWVRNRFDHGLTPVTP